MEQLTEHIEPFLIGLGVGLLLTLIVYIRESMKRRALKRNIKDLKNHLQNKLEIEAEATENRRLEIERLKQENENLRVTNQSLAQKPGRREVVNLHIYQRAVALMMESAAGFAPMWQKALREAEQEADKSEQGKTSFIRRIIPPQFFGDSSGEHKKLKSGEEEDDEHDEHKF